MDVREVHFLGRREIIASMDIGTSNTRVVIGELNEYGTISIVGIGRAPSRGMRKGVVVDIDGVAQAIVEAKEQAERMAGAKVEEFYVGLPVTHVDIISNRGVVAVAGDNKEITIEDVERVLQAARVVAVPTGKEIIDVIPKQFILDGYDGIQDPVGMVGVRLEAEAMLVAAVETALQNLLRCINKAGCEARAFILNPLAAAEVCLSEDEKELGVVLLDIGGGTTELASFKNGSLVNLTSIPLGGDHITNDIAVGLRTTIAAAERIKIEHGFTFGGHEELNRIEIANVGNERRREIDPAALAEIIEPRVEEMVQFIHSELEKLGFDEPPAAGIVLTGGVGQMSGFVDFAEHYLGIPIRVASAERYGVDDPNAVTGVGLTIYAARYKHGVFDMPVRRSKNPNSFINKVFGWLKELWE